MKGCTLKLVIQHCTLATLANVATIHMYIVHKLQLAKPHPQRGCGFAKTDKHLIVSPEMFSVSLVVHKKINQSARSRSPTLLCIVLVGRAGASPLSRYAGADFYIYIHPAMRPFWFPRAPALRANVKPARSHPVTW